MAWVTLFLICFLSLWSAKSTTTLRELLITVSSPCFILPKARSGFTTRTLAAPGLGPKDIDIYLCPHPLVTLVKIHLQCLLPIREPARFRAQQPRKAEVQMLVTELGVFMVSKALHFVKAAFPMHVTDSGISTCLRELQPKNTCSSMLVKQFGIFMVSKALQFAKAPCPMLVTESGISTCLRALQPFNTCSSMLVTQFGIFMVSKALQFAKAASPMLVTESGISTCLRALQP